MGDDDKLTEGHSISLTFRSEVSPLAKDDIV
jgi:hypothetical protein